jgi:ParB family chromosome partitioning protein
MDQARAFQRLSSEFGLTQEQMALRTGKDRATVANLMRLNKLCADGQAFIQSGKISFGHGRALATIEDEKLQFELVHKIVKQELNVRETELLVASYLAPGLMKREPEKPAAEVDPNVKDAIEQLQRILGLKVQIKDRKGRGRVIIDYANLDDFDRLLTQLLK